MDLDWIDLIDIYRPSHPQWQNTTSFSSEHGTFSRTEHMLGHKKSLSNLRWLQSYQASSSITVYKTRNQ